MRSLRAIVCAIFVAAFAAIAIAPAVASAHTITPLTECRYPTANGDWFTFTYQATGLDSGGALIPAGRNTSTEKASCRSRRSPRAPVSRHGSSSSTAARAITRSPCGRRSVIR